MKFIFNNKDLMKVNENEKVHYKSKKVKNFNQLNIVVKKEDDCENTKYKDNEKKSQNKNEKMKNFIILND